MTGEARHCERLEDPVRHRMAAALYGIPGLMVVPRGPDLGAQVILKRKWEKKHWQKYYDRGGKTL